MMQRFVHVAAMVALVGCTETTRSVGVFGTGGAESASASANATEDPPGSDTESSADTTSGSAEESGGDDDAVKLDVATPDGGVPGSCQEGEACTCTAVDVLFVIDNSGTMCTQQAKLADAFPGFVAAMFDALPPNTDLHVGVTTSGFAIGGSHSENNCLPAEPLATIDEYYTRPTEGMVEGNGLQGRLFEYDGQRYFAADTGNAADRPALTQWFTGAATGVGCGVSSFEFNASGAAWALHPENAAYNDGFLRDEETVLVIFILTDEADQSLEMESLEFLHDTVVDAKAGCGGEACIVTGGLIQTFCEESLNASHQFLASFGSDPVIGSIGLGGIGGDDFGAIVGETFAQVVAQTCDDIVPEG